MNLFNKILKIAKFSIFEYIGPQQGKADNFFKKSNVKITKVRNILNYLKGLLSYDILLYRKSTRTSKMLCVKELTSSNSNTREMFKGSQRLSRSDID